MYMFCSRCIRLRKIQVTGKEMYRKSAPGQEKTAVRRQTKARLTHQNFRKNAPQTSGNILVAYFSWADNAILAG